MQRTVPRPHPRSRWGERRSSSSAEPDPRMGRIQAGKSDPGSLVRQALERLSIPRTSLLLLPLPHRSKWIAPPISTPAPRAQWKVPLPLRSRPELRGTLARLPGKAPDVTAERDPKQPPLSYPSFPCARCPHLLPFPPVGSRLGRSKQRAERGSRSQARWEFALSRRPERFRVLSSKTPGRT